MHHPARKHITLTLQLTVDAADAVHAALTAMPEPSPVAKQIRSALARRLRQLEWTKHDDAPENAPILRRLLKRTIAA